jgi:DnaJ-class molecular chaperone
MTSSVTCEEIHKLLDPRGDSSPKEIKRAYRNLVRTYHPDVHPDPGLAQDLFIRITDVYKDLSGRQEGAAASRFHRIFVHGAESTIERRVNRDDDLQVREMLITPDRAHFGGQVLIRFREREIKNIPFTIPPKTRNGQTFLFQNEAEGLKLLLKAVVVLPVNYPPEMKKYL